MAAALAGKSDLILTGSDLAVHAGMFPVLADTQHAKKMTRHGTAQTQCKKGKQGTTRNGKIGRMTRHGTPWTSKPSTLTRMERHAAVQLMTRHAMTRSLV